MVVLSSKLFSSKLLNVVARDSLQAAINLDSCTFCMALSLWPWALS